MAKISGQKRKAVTSAPAQSSKPKLDDDITSDSEIESDVGQGNDGDFGNDLLDDEYWVGFEIFY